MNPCNPDIFKNGHSIATLDACMHRAEQFAQAVARESGQAVDWHYSGGIVNVLYLGAHGAVWVCLKEFEWMLRGETWRRPGECCSCPKPGRHRAGRILRLFGDSTYGPYRAGDPLPPDTIAVVSF